MLSTRRTASSWVLMAAEQNEWIVSERGQLSSSRLECGEMHCVCCGCFLTSNDHSQSRENKTSSSLYKSEIPPSDVWVRGNIIALIILPVYIIFKLWLKNSDVMILTVEELIPNKEQLQYRGSVLTTLTFREKKQELHHTKAVLDKKVSPPPRHILSFRTDRSLLENAVGTTATAYIWRKWIGIQNV